MSGVVSSIAKDLNGIALARDIEEIRARLFAMNTPCLHVPEAIRIFQSESPFVTHRMKFVLLREIWKKAVEIENYRIWNGLITGDPWQQCQLHEALALQNKWVMASIDTNEFRKEIQREVDEGDVDGLIAKFAGMYKNLEQQFNQTIEIIRNKQTNDKSYRYFERPENVKLLRIDLLYVKTRVEGGCAYCETFLEQENNWADYTGYNYLRNQIKKPEVLEKIGARGILGELNIDYSQYKLQEWPCDWNERFCTVNDHPDYQQLLTKEGQNYIFAKGLLINPFFPSMVVTLIQKNQHFKSQIFRALGEKMLVTDKTTGKKVKKIKFNTRELVLAFLEGKEERIQSLIARSVTRDPSRAIVNDPGLYK